MKNDKKITLNENHLRSLTSTLTVVEKYLADMQLSARGAHNGCCYEILNDVDNEAMSNNDMLIKEAREQICDLCEKYGVNKKTRSLQRIIDTLQTKIWEILQDSKSRRIKSFGTFSKDLAKEYDDDINKLMAIISKITY